MTAKEAEKAVKERYPEAVCSRQRGEYRVWSLPHRSPKGVGIPLSLFMSTRGAAWKSAAYRTGCDI